MAKTYGLNFPFRNSMVGDFLQMTTTPEKEIRSNLIHLLLTRRGTRYFLPDFGTRLYEFIFDMNDSITHEQINGEIRETVKKYIPNLEITSLEVFPAENDEDEYKSVTQEEDERLFRTSSETTRPYTAKIKLTYTINNGTFSSSDFVILNI